MEVFFYRGASGSEPVRSWLKSLSKQDRIIIGEDIKTVQTGWPVGMPVCRPLGNGLWEIRSHLTGKRISRVFFIFNGESMVLLNGFIKKTGEIPQAELELAIERKKQIEAING